MSYPGTQRDVKDLEGQPAKSVTTEFDETVTAGRLGDISLNPTWGASVLRDETVLVGGGSVSSSNGELEVACSAAASDSALVRTLARSSYAAGSQGQVGVGIRIPTDAVNNQEARWGLFDDDNGFGFGQDATGTFIFFRTGGAETKVYQNSWNIDQADGTGQSGRTLTPSKGVIYHVDFVWYGYGSLVFAIYIDDGASGVKKRVPVHQFTPDGALSIADPNQPIRVECSNGAAGGAYALYVGGRQFSLFGGKLDRNRRKFSEPIYGTVLSTAWLPIIAMRRKATLNGGPNSVRAFVLGLEALAGADMEFRITFGGTVTSGGWVAPADVPATETCSEVQPTPTVSDIGIPVERAALAAARGGASAALEQVDRVELGFDTQVILWARAFSGTPTLTAAYLNWEEQW